ncbi:MAG: DUF2325 domain-containing protein [Piscinibacter sp.]
MSSIPFRPALLPTALPWSQHTDPRLADDLCCSQEAQPAGVQLGARARLAELDPHLHCSVIGTCLSTGELRKLMAPHMHVAGASDLEVHHESVRLVSCRADVAKLLHKALDKRHDAALQRFARAKDEAALVAAWDDALRSGEVPAAYWAVLTHRRSTPQARQRAFGDVHMLSHLVGAANRADIRRLVALEADNQDLRDRLERAQGRHTELQAERDAAAAQRDHLAALQDRFEQRREAAEPDAGAVERLAEMSVAVGLQTQRRERAEAAAQHAAQEASRLAAELQCLHEQFGALAEELAAAETQLQGALQTGDPEAERLARGLQGRRVLYVGGRPSSTPAIRELVARFGGELRKHDGGIEDRKGLLAPALAWADWVVFPVDCIDHDSALALKRECQRRGKPFQALRSASVASFLAAVTARADLPLPQG